MSIETHVTSLELSKRLKELGVEQSALFGWYNRQKTDGIGGYVDNFEVYLIDEEIVWYEVPLCSAYLASELGDMLPSEIETEHNIFFLEIDKVGMEKWGVVYRNKKLLGGEISKARFMHSETLHGVIADTEAEARGKMLVYLLEQGLIINQNKL